MKKPKNTSSKCKSENDLQKMGKGKKIINEKICSQQK